MIRVRNTSHRLIWLITLLSFLSSSLPVRAQMIPDPTQNLPGIDVTESAIGRQTLSPQDEEQVRNYLGLPTQYTLEIMFLFKNLYLKMKQAEEKLGSDRIIEILQKRKDSENIEYENEHIGKAEPIVLDIGYNHKPIIITKVRHNGLKMSILFFDTSQIDYQELINFERADRTGLLKLYGLFQGLSSEQISNEIKYRRLLIKKLRVLWSRMLMSEWNPQLEYSPLTELDVSPQQSPKENLVTENTVQEQVQETLESPLDELVQKKWFQKVLDKGFQTWVDLSKFAIDIPKKTKTKLQSIPQILGELAREEEELRQKSDGNESLMIIGLNSRSGQITGKSTIQRQPKTSLEYWKDLQRTIWEQPAYDKNLWQKSHGLKKFRVLLTGDYLMGLSFGIGLGALSYFTANLFPASLPQSLTPFDVARISFTWSLTFGVLSRTWQNFVYRGNEAVRFIKNWSTGISQSYQYNLESSASLSFFDAYGNTDWKAIKTHADILINQSIKSSSKTSMQETPRFRAKVGEAEGTLQIPYFKIKAPWRVNQFAEFEMSQTTFDMLKYVRKGIELSRVRPYEPKKWEEFFKFTLPDVKIKFPWIVTHEANPQTGENERLLWDTSIPQTNFEGQLPQLISTPVGLLSRFGFMATVSLFSFHFAIPIGHIAYALLGPLGEMYQIRYKLAYAKKINELLGQNHAFAKRISALANFELQRWNDITLNKRVNQMMTHLYEKTTQSKSPLILFSPITIPLHLTYSIVDKNIAYYMRVIPAVLTAGKQISQWTLRQFAYYSIKAYDSVLRPRNNQDSSQESKAPMTGFACKRLFE